MKKIVLSLAGLLAATVFAPEAAAVPSFARQVGMACNACHFQSYPVLNSFGRAFKTSGYTLMGAQALVEGEHGVSLPSVLNASIYFQGRYIQVGNPTGAAKAPGSRQRGAWEFPDEFALFFGGRISEGIGFLLEGALTNPQPAATGSTAFLNFKIPFTFEMAGGRAMVTPFTSTIGPAYGYDVFATGSVAGGRILDHGAATGAMHYLSVSQLEATGVTLGWAGDAGFVTVTPYAPGFAVANGASANMGGISSLNQTYIRAALTPSSEKMGGWDTGFGIQSLTGGDACDAGMQGTPATLGIVAGFPAVIAAKPCGINSKVKATAIDAQAQGEVSGLPLGLYASYGSASGSTATETNIINLGQERRQSFNVLADLGVIPGTLAVQLGLGFAKTGYNEKTAAGANIAGTSGKDNSVTVGVRYKLRQNVKLAAMHTSGSGSAYDRDPATGAQWNGGTATGNGTVGNGAGNGKTRTTLILSTAF